LFKRKKKKIQVIEKDRQEKENHSLKRKKKDFSVYSRRKTKKKKRQVIEKDGKEQENQTRKTKKKKQISKN